MEFDYTVGYKALTIVPGFYYCLAERRMLYFIYGTIVLQGGWPLFIHRMGVVLMDKKPFDFKDLMTFGMFVLALLTFVFTFVK